VDNSSPLALIKQLETQIIGLLAAVDVYDLPTTERKVVTTLKRELADARLDIRDYEFSETRDEQLQNALVAKERLRIISKHILKVSEYNIFSAVDVALASAQLERIIEKLG
jgi:hypothetical protein